MIAWLRSAGRTLAASPGWQLVAGGAILALAFPARAPGTIGMLVLAGAIGIAVARAWPQLPAWLRTPQDQLASAAVVAVVVASGLSTFWDTIAISPDWQMGDWGPQHAVLSRVMHALPGLGAPVWNHAAGTGDAPLELYPRLAYLVTGHAALALGLDNDLPRAMMIVAVAVHVVIAATTAMITLRIAPRPVALVVGVLTVVDSGAVAHGGTVGLFRWALLHSAMALMLWTIAALGILGALRRPRVRASAAIWIATALACVAHPAGLIAAAAAIVALAAVALLASDVPPRRALAAAGHVALGVALGAAVWMPLAARILEYGQHFPNAVRSPARLLEDMLSWVSPVTSYSMLGYAGYFGIVAGLWSRRAAVVFVSATALVLLVGLCDAGYLAFDLAPGMGVARLGTERLAQLARPFVMAAGGYGIALFTGAAIRGWRGAGPRQRAVAAALIGVMSAAVVRALPAVWESSSNRAFNESQVIAPDRAGRIALTEWATRRAAELAPDAWARAVFETTTHEHFHLTALTGLPTLHNGPQPDLLLRERIEDLSPASLRRFNIRWAIAQDHSPVLGDPASERVLGSFHIREIKEWDGAFARIERGDGELRVTRLDDDAVEIEVSAPRPVLVALGTGYYPRWRARHASGADEPVYALPATPAGTLHVVAAWLAPGHTTFTVDGPLPSDHDGRVATALAALLALALAVAWQVGRWRIRILRRLAALRARLPAITPLAARIAVPLVVAGLVVRGCTDAAAPMRALQLGSGVRGAASVEARIDGGVWQTCGYERVVGTYSCADLLVAYDAMASLLNDAPPSWAFNTPGIAASAYRPGVEIRVRLDERLAGAYWIAATEPTELTVNGEPMRQIERATVDYADRGERSLELVAPVPTTGWQLSFVREDTLVPRRDYLAGPPASPPTAVTAISAAR